MLTSLSITHTGESELTDKRIACIFSGRLMLPSAIPFSKAPKWKIKQYQYKPILGWNIVPGELSESSKLQIIN